MKHLFRLRAFIKPYIRHIAANIAALLAVTGLSLVSPGGLEKVIDDGLLHGQVGYLARAAFLLLGLGIAIALLNLAQRYLSEWTAAHIGYDLRNAMYDRIQYLPFTFHDHTQSGQLITRCIEDVRSVQDFFGSSIIEIVQLLFLSAGVIAMMVSIDPQLAAIALLPFIPLAVLTSLFGDRVTKLFYNVDLTLGDLSTRCRKTSRACRLCGPLRARTTRSAASTRAIGNISSPASKSSTNGPRSCRRPPCSSRSARSSSCSSAARWSLRAR